MKIFPFPEVVFETSSQLSGDIKVVGSGPQRKLIVGGLVQSVSRDFPGLENKVWSKMLEFNYQLNPDPEVLVLGLGGGTSIHLISKKLRPKSIKAVEIDGAVVEVAKNFFDLDTVANLVIEKADALEYVSRDLTNLFDLILVDIYLGANFPTEASKTDFLKNFKGKLKRGGMVSINRIFYDHEVEARNKFKISLAHVFGDVEERALPGVTSMKNYLYFVHV
jgi:spermidine synthase